MESQLSEKVVSYIEENSTFWRICCFMELPFTFQLKLSSLFHYQAEYCFRVFNFGMLIKRGASKSTVYLV
jgi:hypothetical protein